MFLFASQLDYSDDTIQRLEQLVTFVTHAVLFTHKWMTVTLAADVPLDDLHVTMMLDMMKYKKLYSEIAKGLS